MSSQVQLVLMPQSGSGGVLRHSAQYFRKRFESLNRCQPAFEHARQLRGYDNVYHLIVANESNIFLCEAGREQPFSVPNLDCSYPDRHMPRSSAAFCGRPMKRAVRLRSLSICPRCQFRLALQTKRPTYQQSFRTFTTQRSLRQETALLEVPAGDVSIPFPAPQDPSTTPLPLQISYESYGSPVIRYEPHDPPSAEQQRARKHSLGLDVLGKPAEVLIVEREKRKRRSLSLPLSHIKSDVPKDGPEAHDILRHVDREKESTTLEDVYRNIEDMRDSWLGNQRDAEDVFEDNEWEELASLLRESFSRRQLQTYIERLEDEGAPDTEYLKESYAGRTISRAVWKAGHSPITEARAPQLLKKGSKTNPEVQTNTTRLQYDDKDTLIDKLVSNYWNIRRISLETDVGFLDIKLPQSHFDLILHSRK